MGGVGSFCDSAFNFASTVHFGTVAAVDKNCSCKNRDCLFSLKFGLTIWWDN